MCKRESTKMMLLLLHIWIEASISESFDWQTLHRLNADVGMVVVAHLGDSEKCAFGANRTSASLRHLKALQWWDSLIDLYFKQHSAEPLVGSWMHYRKRLATSGSRGWSKCYSTNTSPFELVARDSFTPKSLDRRSLCILAAYRADELCECNCLRPFSRHTPCWGVSCS